MSATRSPGAVTRAGAARTDRAVARSDFGAALALTVTLTTAAVLALMALQLLVVHPGITGLNGATGVFNQQNQKVKTDLYVATFVVILPLSLLFCSRLADALGEGPNGEALPVFAAALAGSLAAALIVVRLSGALPWGSGVKGVLAAVLVWSVLAALALWRITRSRSWEALHRLSRRAAAVYALTAALAFGVLLSVTSAASLTPLPLLIGGAVAIAVLLAHGRVSLPHVGRPGLALDALVIVILLLAIPDVIVFRDPTGIPNFLFDPGVVQFQHDWLLGATNQLLGGGALLVGNPLSQYGVGLIYFLAGWFHLAPIGYGTFGFLDGLLTALFYACGYAVLRMAGVRRLLATAAIALGVLAFVYNFQYFVGQLPEEGPLRFGLPMLVVLGFVVAIRFPHQARAGRLLALFALGVSAVWALEAFAYTAFTYLAVVAAETWLAARPERRTLLGRRLIAGLAACVIAHLAFALATLIGSGHLPDWGQYFAYVHELLFGSAGTITYGFANWSPGLAFGAGTLASTAAIVLLAQRKPALGRAQPALLVGLTGSTAYSIALLSYVDNRSSTYLLLYVALPLLLAGTLWLALVLAPGTALAPPVRRGALAAALAIAVLLFSGAWSSIGDHFSRTALARAYPGGGLAAALHRLWHSPPIDPRTREGIRLLDAYAPGKRVIILLPTLPDLGDEILIRGHRSNLLPIGDPKADGLVQSVWLPRVRPALGRLRPGQRILIDERALSILPALRNPRVDPLRGAIAGGGIEVEWILQALDRRFRIVPIARGSGGLIVARLAAR